MRQKKRFIALGAAALLAIVLISLASPAFAAEVLVVVDPGHGGEDPGAVGKNGTREKDVNLDIAQQLAGLLKQAGYNPVLTRTGDSNPSLSQRVEFANGQPATIFISVHSNAAPSSSANGIEVWYSSEGHPLSKDLATVLLNHMVAALRLSSRGVKEGSFYVIRKTKMPAALVEVAFLSNPEEEKLLNDPNFRARAARALFDGIVEFFRKANLTASEGPRADIALNNIANGATVPPKFKVIVDATVDVKRVAFYLDGRLKNIDRKAPFTKTLKFSKGEHVITIVGMDKNKNVLVQKEIKVVRA